MMTYEPKPRNWRTFYGYRPSRSLNWLASDRNRDAEHEYLDWLAKARGWTFAEAKSYALSFQHCGLISTVHNGPELPIANNVVPLKAAHKTPPVSRIVAAIKILPWSALDKVQAAIDERLAA